MRSPLLPLALGTLLALLGACAPRSQPVAFQPATYSGPLTPRPADSPDVLILTISGRCPCLSGPLNNVEYLNPRGTVKAVASAFEAQGLTVQHLGVAAHLTVHQPTQAYQSQLGADAKEAPAQLGFVQLEGNLIDAYQQWIYGRSNPTRIVLLAHSHGVVWTHALTRAHPEIPISLLIDLDGVCDLWEQDNRALIQDYVAFLGRNPWPFDLSNACGSVRVGKVRYDLKDVVYPNVAVNLEVQSQRFVRVAGGLQANFPFDALHNVRPDGSTTGIQTFRSRDTHSNITLPDGESLRWVRERIAETVGGWRKTDTAPSTP